MLTNLFVDYEYSLWGLPDGSKERERVKREVHSRSALKLQELCFRNGGIYIKLGQHISQLVCCYFLLQFIPSVILNSGFHKISLFQEYLVPDEYVQVMRQSMLNKCPVSSYEQVLQVFKKELGGAPDEVSTLIQLK